VKNQRGRREEEELKRGRNKIVVFFFAKVYHQINIIQNSFSYLFSH
jgi:hypothetical protein